MAETPMGNTHRGERAGRFHSTKQNCQAAKPVGSACLQPGEQGKGGCSPMIPQPCTHALEALVTIP